MIDKLVEARMNDIGDFYDDYKDKMKKDDKECLELFIDRMNEDITCWNFYSYVFNATPTNRERGVAREAEAGYALELEIRNILPFKELIRIDG